MSSLVSGQHQRVAPLGLLTMIGLLGFALGFAGMLFLAGQIIVPLLILALLSLAGAFLVATGVRWMPLLGALYCVATMISGLVTIQNCRIT